MLVVPGKSQWQSLGSCRTSSVTLGRRAVPGFLISHPLVLFHPHIRTHPLTHSHTILCKPTVNLASIGRQLRRRWQYGGAWKSLRLYSVTLDPTESADSAASEFLRFNPLPPKKTSKASLYTGPKRWPATDSYYRQFAGASKSLVRSRNVKGTVSPHAVDAGDVVEVVSRDGTIQGFGMVSFSTAKNFFDFITLEGVIEQAHVSETSISFKGFFPELPANKYKVEEVSSQLRDIVDQGISGIDSALPLLVAIHAKLALQDRPRAIDFEDVSNRVTQLLYPRVHKQYSVSQVSIYFAMAYHSLNFVRLNRSPFVAVSSRALDAVNKVMYALTRVELDHGVTELLHKESSNTSYRQSSLAQILGDFLDHWALWNDPRLSRAAEAVLEKCDGKSRLLDTPRAMSTALNKLEGVRLFPWMSADQARSQALPTVLHNGKSSPEKRERAESMSHSRYFQSRIFTSNLVRECFLLDKSTAVSVDDEGSTLSVFIPHMPRIPSLLSSMSPLGIAARSTILQNNFSSLIPPPTVERYAFRAGKQCLALRMSIRLDMHSLDVEHDSAFIDTSEIIPTMQQPSPVLKRLLRSFEPLISDHEMQLPSSPTDDSWKAEQQASDYNYKEDDDEAGPTDLLSAQAAAGRIAGLFMQKNKIEAPFLVTSHGRELASSHAGKHSRLNTEAYVPIARPFDSSLALLAQRQLFVKPITPVLYSGKSRPPLVAKLQQTILPQLRVLAEYELRDLAYWILKDLQSQLRRSATFHIFRCILLDSSIPGDRSQGQIVRAFCLDLGIQVEVFVPPHTEQVFEGDQVIGTEILELDPLQGLFVVSM